MKDNIAIKVEDVGKEFLIPHEKRTSLKQHFVNLFQRVEYRKFEAIQKVDLEVKQGEFFSIIGPNGSGKSTLLKILAGIYTPTRGEVTINGRLSPFIELGVGFNMELTARENIYLNGAILGLKREEINYSFNDILDFAELRDFVDQKLKNFSSGMLVRLAFSVAIRAHADILLIDEVLAVGDSNFQQKCYDVFRQLKAQGKTIIFVSHDLGSVKEFSDRVLILAAGHNYGIFSAQEAIAKYSDLNQMRANKELDKLTRERPVVDKGIHVASVQMLDKSGTNTHAFKRGEPATVELEIKNPKKVKISVGVAVYRNDGLYCFGTNTGVDSYELTPKDVMRVAIHYPHLNLQNGTYYLVIGLAGDGKVYQMLEQAYVFQVSNTDGNEGVVFFDHEWSQV